MIMEMKEPSIEAYYDNIVEMVHTQKPDILGHLDLVRELNRDGRYFDENVDHIRKIDYVLDEIAKTQIPLLKNKYRGNVKRMDRHLHLVSRLLNKILDRNIWITISSDVHAVENIDFYFKESIDIVKEIGFVKVKNP